MKKYVIISLFSVLLFSCKTANAKKSSKAEVFKEIEFKNHAFEKLFKASLNDLDIYIEGEKKTIILEFYIDPDKGYDTIVNIKNCPPVCVKNLIYVKKYKDQYIYIYYTKNLEHIVNGLIDSANDPIKFVNLTPVPNEFECIYKKAFVLKNDKFIPSE